jgi:hypothetical protein
MQKRLLAVFIGVLLVVSPVFAAVHMRATGTLDTRCAAGPLGMREYNDIDAIRLHTSKGGPRLWPCHRL